MVDGKMVILGADELAERKEEIQESLKAQRENNFTKNENRDTIPLSRLEKMNVLKKPFKIGKLRFYVTLIHKVIHRFCGWKMAINTYQ